MDPKCPALYRLPLHKSMVLKLAFIFGTLQPEMQRKLVMYVATLTDWYKKVKNYLTWMGKY